MRQLGHSAVAGMAKERSLFLRTTLMTLVTSLDATGRYDDHQFASALAAGDVVTILLVALTTLPLHRSHQLAVISATDADDTTKRNRHR